MTASFDPATNLVLVADAGANDRVQVFDSSGNLLLAAGGGGGAGDGFDEGVGGPGGNGGGAGGGTSEVAMSATAFHDPSACLRYVVTYVP